MKTVNVDLALHREIKAAAAHLGRTVREVVAEALANWLAAYRRNGGKA